jgi:hypothetical protein
VNASRLFFKLSNVNDEIYVVNIPTANLFSSLQKTKKKPAEQKEKKAAPKEIRVTTTTTTTPTPTAATPTPAAEKVPETKQEREAKDHHLDRSAKGNRERKGGAGRGGWDETPDKTQAEAIAEVAAPSSNQPAPADEEKPEAEKPAEPQVQLKTLDEYMAERVKVAPKVQKTRKIDESGFKGMAKLERGDEAFLPVKPVKKEAAKPAAPAAKETKPAEKKVLKTFFRMDRPRRERRDNREGGERGGEKSGEGDQKPNEAQRGPRGDRGDRRYPRERREPQQQEQKEKTPGPEDFPELSAALTA